MSANNFRFKEPQGYHNGENISFGSPQPVFRHPQNSRGKEKDGQKSFISHGSQYSYHVYDNQNAYPNYNVPTQMNMHHYDQFGQVNDNYYNVGFPHDGQFVMSDPKNIQFSSGRMDPAFFNVPHFDSNQQHYYQDSYYTRMPPNQNYGSMPIPYSQIGMSPGVQDHQVPRPRANFNSHRMPRNSPSSRYPIPQTDHSNHIKSRNSEDISSSLQQRMQNTLRISSSSSSPVVSKSLIDSSPVNSKLLACQKSSTPMEFNMNNDDFPTLSESNGPTNVGSIPYLKHESAIETQTKNQNSFPNNKAALSNLTKFPYKISEITKFFNDFVPFQTSEKQDSDDKYLTSGLLKIKHKSISFGRKLKEIITNIDSTDEPIIHQLLISPSEKKITQDHLIDFPVSYEYLIYQAIKDRILKFDCARFSDDVLFYVYYVEMGDATQMLAAYNLYLRKWRFYSVDKIWVKILIPYTAGDEYKFFDQITWQVMVRDETLDLTRLDDNQLYMPYMNHDTRVVLAQTIEEDEQIINSDDCKNNYNEDPLI